MREGPSWPLMNTLILSQKTRLQVTPKQGISLAEDKSTGSPWPREGQKTELVLRHLSCLRHTVKSLGQNPNTRYLPGLLPGL